jgi:hypothetical protein
VFVQTLDAVAMKRINTGAKKPFLEAPEMGWFQREILGSIGTKMNKLTKMFILHLLLNPTGHI